MMTKDLTTLHQQTEHVRVLHCEPLFCEIKEFINKVLQSKGKVLSTMQYTNMSCLLM